MNQRILMWGLTTIVFVAALSFSSWQQGLWPSEDHATRVSRPPVTRSPETLASADAEPTAMPARPFAPAKAAPVTEPPQAPAATAEPAAPAETPPPPMPVAEAEVDTTEFLAHRDRAAQHSSRAR